ncbi:methyltransferase domain-containing protein [Streptomyces sp. ET3-23]|uniref:class I SAM-dependent methyltransferase n=1 Tax=Streptomyces sp. ET3-23 TaxID=2885643 RepID=UPI001D1111EC|nr:class I SAM-dependent methyltransferase [Streptomyces sp. ET3-23]MCC2276589.1 methyltransferase domain-containing protein [Streptomyces sp. ET3-23]
MTPQYDEIAAHYREVDRVVGPYREGVEIPSLLHAIGGLNGASVLDLGCGVGPFTRVLRRQGAAAVLGVDASVAMIELARRREREEQLGVRYEVHDITGLPVLGAFDIVTAALVLHYADSRSTLERMCRSAYANLAPGGRLLAIVGNPGLQPEISQPNGFVLHRPDQLRDGDPYTISIPTTPPTSLAVHYWSRAAYEEALQNCGFTDVSWEPMLGLPADAEPVGLLFSARRPEGGGEGRSAAVAAVGAGRPV